MTAVFQEDITHAGEIQIIQWTQRPFSEKIKERFFVLFRRRL